MSDLTTNSKKKQTQEIIQASLPAMDLIQQELGSAKSMDDFGRWHFSQHFLSVLRFSGGVCHNMLSLSGHPCGHCLTF